MAKENMDKGFPITSVARDDIASCMGKKIATSLTDREMERVADKLASAYCENGFWISLPIVVEYIVNERRK